MIFQFQVSQWYDLVVFTASMEIYGAAVADKLDNSRGILHKRYYRQVSILTLLTSLQAFIICVLEASTLVCSENPDEMVHK